MNNREYIWIFDSSSLFDDNAPLSLEYHAQEKLLDEKTAQKMIGARVWLVMKTEQQLYLYGTVSPELIEQYTAGKYTGDYLISTNPYMSLRFLPRNDSKNSWSIKLDTSDVGIRESTESDVTEILKCIEKNTKVGFANVSKKTVSETLGTTLKSIEFMVPDQLALVLRTVSFGDIQRPNNAPQGLSAFSNLALEKLKANNPDLDIEPIIKILRTLDPLSVSGTTQTVKKASGQKDTGYNVPPIVDTVLEDIDPEKISPRTFIASSDISSLGWLDKTQEAEESHENMLKDVVIHLQKYGYKTKKSRSFDLVAEKNGRKYLFELKSANLSNLVSQGEKAMIQLLRYSCALDNQNSKDWIPTILISKVDSPDVYVYLNRMCSKTDLNLFIYDSNSEWPNRISSLSGSVNF